MGHIKNVLTELIVDPRKWLSHQGLKTIVSLFGLIAELLSTYDVGYGIDSVENEQCLF